MQRDVEPLLGVGPRGRRVLQKAEEGPATGEGSVLRGPGSPRAHFDLSFVSLAVQTEWNYYGLQDLPAHPRPGLEEEGPEEGRGSETGTDPSPP